MDRISDRERLKLAMDQPETIGGTDWIEWLTMVNRELNKDADHIRALEAQLESRRAVIIGEFLDELQDALCTDSEKDDEQTTS